jgi:hypothetical protein
VLLFPIARKKQAYALGRLESNNETSNQEQSQEWGEQVSGSKLRCIESLLIVSEVAVGDGEGYNGQCPSVRHQSLAHGGDEQAKGC